MTVDPIVLPITKRAWGQVRILVQSAWGKPWLKLSMLSEKRNGFKLLHLNRTTLPDEGTAVFRLPYGKIDGKLYQDDTFPDLSLSAPDLHQYGVRIQGQISTGDWKTIWWGKCVAMRDATFPGSDTPAGDMDYHCVDGFSYLRQWYLDYHQSYWNGATSRGRRHPGYNALHGRGDREPTNADPLGLGFVAHVWPGVGITWTDQQVVEHALASSVPGLWDVGIGTGPIAAQRALHPSFSIIGATSWLQGVNVYEVHELEDVRSLLTRVFERGRGRGNAQCSWADDTAADPTGPLSPKINIKPSVKDDISVTRRTGGTLVLSGSDTMGTTREVNVIGDHRLGQQAQRTFRCSAASDIEYNGVEVRGEFINVLANASEKDTSLAGRWQAAELTDLTAATPKQRELNEPKFDHVLRRWGIPFGWDMQCGDGTGNNRSRVDYRCDVDGTIKQPSGDTDTSPLVISIAERLPMYFGYDYSVSPIVTFHGDPPGDVVLVPLEVWIRVNDSPERYINGAHRMGISISRAEQDLQIRCSEDQGGQYRRIGDTTVSSLSSLYNSNQMVVLLAFQLPERVRLLSGEDGQKTKRITVRNHHLWISHPEAIIGLDPATVSNGGNAPKRPVSTNDGPFGATVAILRDDRDRLAVILAEASVWYLNRRQTATWTLHDIGWSDGWNPAQEDGTEDDTTLIPWPELGDLVDTFSYSGRTETIQTPITRTEYDHEQGTFTWVTSWSDRDWR